MFIEVHALVDIVTVESIASVAWAAAALERAVSIRTFRQWVTYFVIRVSTLVHIVTVGIEVISVKHRSVTSVAIAVVRAFRVDTLRVLAFVLAQKTLVDV